MVRSVLLDERAGVSADWLVLSAGVMILGLAVAYEVMIASHNSLLVKFDQVDKNFEKNAENSRTIGGAMRLNP
jgi:hypothetical protein